MTLTILRYIPLALASLIADILAFLLAPIASLPIFITLDRYGRENISKFWQWITTHDAPIDLYVHHTEGQSKHWYLSRFTPEQILESGWLRYCCRVFWIWRNPAYRFDHGLGYDQTGVVLIKHLDGSDTWDTGVPSESWWTATNAKGQKAFLWEKQWYFYKQRCLEMQFGWKLYRNDPDKRCMLAFRINPFRTYG